MSFREYLFQLAEHFIHLAPFLHYQVPQHDELIHQFGREYFRSRLAEGLRQADELPFVIFDSFGKGDSRSQDARELLTNALVVGQTAGMVNIVVLKVPCHPEVITGKEYELLKVSVDGKLKGFLDDHAVVNNIADEGQVF